MNVKLNRRKFVSSLGVLGVGGLCPLPALASVVKELPPEEALLKTEPYLQSPAENQITIRWITSVPCFSWVEYGEAPEHLGKKAVTTAHGLIEAYNTVNAVTLTGLQPGKDYFYRIVSKKFEGFEPYQITYGEIQTSPVYTFKTVDPAAESISFLVFNDIHDRPESFAHLMEFNGNEQMDFAFLNGDMFNFQSDENQIVDHLLKPLGDLFSTKTPFYFSRGNHETRGRFARQLPQYFNSDNEDYFFSFQWGPLYVIVLDSGEDKEDNTPVYAGLADFDAYRIRQADWLKNEIQKDTFKRAKYKVVFSHIPLYYSGNWHGTMHCREAWGKILNEAKIDLLISGHTHVYEIRPAREGLHNYPIVIGGGPADGTRTVIKVKADHQRLDLTMLNDSGTVCGRLTC